MDGGPGWVSEYLRVTADGWFVVASYWAVLTLGWALWRASQGLEGEVRSNFKSLCWTCFGVMVVPFVGILCLGGWTTFGLAGMLLFGPMAGWAPALLGKRKMPPMYSRAIAKMKFGKYTEAEWEIIRELEKSEDDFNGWMMMAELYATHFKDLSEAEQTILEICDQPRTTISQVSVALHKLADWHLKIAENPDAARRALQMICDRMPGTHLAHMAQLRANKLPESAEEFRRQQSAEPIPLPSHDPLAETSALPAMEENHDRAAAMANECVASLQDDPNDVGAREKLARLMAERLDKADLGLEQIGLLLNLPDQHDGKRAEWLALMAAWNLNYRHDLETGRKFMERLIREFPESPQAYSARRKMQAL
jgi:hypothetical protein